MTMQANAMAARLSKFKVGELALKSALDIERARAGLPYEKTHLIALAEALRVSTGEERPGDRVAYMRPGYFEPFERVYRSSHDVEPKSASQIRAYVSEAITKIGEATAGEVISEPEAEKLVDFCIGLNREFVRRNPTENRIGRRQRSVAVEAFVR